MTCRPPFLTSHFTQQVTFLWSTEGCSLLPHLPLHTSLQLHERLSTDLVHRRGRACVHVCETCECERAHVSEMSACVSVRRVAHTCRALVRVTAAGVLVPPGGSREGLRSAGPLQQGPLLLANQVAGVVWSWETLCCSGRGRCVRERSVFRGYTWGQRGARRGPRQGAGLSVTHSHPAPASKLCPSESRNVTKCEASGLAAEDGPLSGDGYLPPCTFWS